MPANDPATAPFNLTSVDRAAIERQLYYASNSHFDWFRPWRNADPASIGVTNGVANPAPTHPAELAVTDPRILLPSGEEPARSQPPRHTGRVLSSRGTPPPRSLPPHDASRVWPRGVGWERHKEPFLVPVIHYLWPFFAERNRPEPVELHIICTNKFDEGWGRFMRRFGRHRPQRNASDSPRLDAEYNRTWEARSPSSRVNRTRGWNMLPSQLKCVTSGTCFSDAARDYVRECLYREDWQLFQRLCT